MATGTAEQETLKLMFSYLVNSIDTAALLPAALSRQLITEPQRLECFSEPDPNKRAEKFLGHLQRAVNGDSNKYHIFVQLLSESGQESIASHLKTQEEFTRSSLAATASNSEVDHVVVDIPDTLFEELVDLRIAYAELLRSYEKELRRSPEAQKEFVEFLPRLLRRNFSTDQTFQFLFDKLIEEEVSPFKIHYLKRICSIFPEDVCAATRKLVDQYEQQLQHFMTGTTVSQFKKLFPASATPHKLSAEKIPIKLKLSNLWDNNTLEDLNHLVINLGVPLRLCDITHAQ